MSYCDVNFKSKKALKEAVARGEQIGIFNPGLGTPTVNGSTCLEGPHYPAAHTWYAQVEMRDGIITKVK